MAFTPINFTRPPSRPARLVIAYFRGQGDEVANKEFHNSKLGLPFIGENAQVTDDDAGRRRAEAHDQ